jgi:hypothetical protein
MTVVPTYHHCGLHIDDLCHLMCCKVPFHVARTLHCRNSSSKVLRWYPRFRKFRLGRVPQLPSSARKGSTTLREARPPTLDIQQNSVCTPLGPGARARAWNPARVCHPPARFGWCLGHNLHNLRLEAPGQALLSVRNSVST